MSTQCVRLPHSFKHFCACAEIGRGITSPDQVPLAYLQHAAPSYTEPLQSQESQESQESLESQESQVSQESLESQAPRASFAPQESVSSSDEDESEPPPSYWESANASEI
eukprot:m.184721 g.184721  ORF g.184721 m.184721 type:complete len:110 (-) comp53527_c0_seq18:285-614(-)